MDKYLQEKLDEQSGSQMPSTTAVGAYASQGQIPNGEHVRVRWLGRARRSEYLPIAIVLNIIIGVINKADDASGVSSIIGLFLLVILIIESIRRLHDMGKSGWWVISFIIPFVWFMTFCKGQEGPNEYGPNPRAC